MESGHVVVVEDDEGIGRSLTRTLAGEGYDVRWARSGHEAQRLVEPSTTLVVLDLGLPDVDGLEICRWLRARSHSPQVLILTARGDEADVVLGLDAGADDYLAKPFRLTELLARVRACFRRHRPSDRINLGAGLVVDQAAHTIHLDGYPLKVRPKEFELLVVLARDAGRVVPRERLMADLWSDYSSTSTKTLDIHIWSLRQKLDKPGEQSRITTIRGLGYRLELR